MFLPRRLLAIKLQRSSCWKEFLHYEKCICKVESNSLRIKFLENCKRAEIIQRFLKFRIPNNGCFDDKNVQDFQNRLLNKELQQAKSDLQTMNNNLHQMRKQLLSVVPLKCLPSIALYSRHTRLPARREQEIIHNKKLVALSEEQERPLFNVKNTVVLCGVDIPPPRYVMETLALGPKKFNTR